MPKYFSHLSKHNDGTSILDNYKISDLQRMVVLRDEGSHNRFLLFESRDEFDTWYRGVPDEQRCFHEVIFGQLPQRIKFDIDMMSDKLTSKETVNVQSCDDLIDEILGDGNGGGSGTTYPLEVYQLVDGLIRSIIEELYDSYFYSNSIYPTRGDIVVTDSTGSTAGGVKHSFHIIANYCLANSDEAKDFTHRVLKRIPEGLHRFVDTSVNKKIQCFRLLNSTKPGANRYKRVTRAFGTSAGTGDRLLIVAPVGTKAMRKLVANEAKPQVAVQEELIQEVLSAAAGKGILEGHEYTESIGSLLCFKRTSPSFCRICNEVHHNDNSLMIGLGEDAAYEMCRQNNSKKLLICQSVKPELRFANKIEGIVSGKLKPRMSTKFDELPESSKHVYDAPCMLDYELVPTLVVSAQMKLGKTKALRTYINRFYSESAVIRFVTFRQTFSNSISKDFPDFTMYSSIAGEIGFMQRPRLIVQVESLHRCKMGQFPEPIDLLILDEVESIFAQFNSGLHKHFNAAFAMFQWMLRTAKHVVCMDANISDRTFNIVERFRPNKQLLFHQNCFARAAEDNYEFTMTMSHWLGKLHSELLEGKKVVIPTNSLVEAKAITDVLSKEFPKKKIMLYSSETDQGEKSRHFADVHKYWSMLDVLVFTPTCSAGVSFELEHFDSLFGYFCDTSCDVETCRQMLGRVRNIRSKNHYICLRGSGACLPTTTEEIRKQIYSKRASLFSDSNIQFEYDDDGKIQFYESNYFHMWLENIRMINISKNRFVSLFIEQVAGTGAKVGTLMPVENMKNLSACLATSKEEIRGARCAAIAEAPDLTTEEFLKLQENIQEIDPISRLAYEKHKIKETYSWKPELTAEFVATYNSPGAKKIYFNLTRICEGKSVNESLMIIKRREGDNYKYTMALREHSGADVESRDLMRDKISFSYRSHQFAIWLLNICGFECITDEQRVYQGAIYANLHNALELIEGSVKALTFEFNINIGSTCHEENTLKFISKMLKFINKILRSMYGIYISKVSSQTAFCLRRESMFVLAPEGSDSCPVIPSNLLRRPPSEVKYFIDMMFYESMLHYGDDTM